MQSSDARVFPADTLCRLFFADYLPEKKYFIWWIFEAIN